MAAVNSQNVVLYSLLLHTHTLTLSLTYSKSSLSERAAAARPQLVLAPFALTDCVFVQLLTSRL